MVPAPDTSGFPLDGTIRIFLRGFDPAVRARLGEEYRLREETGALIPITTRVDGTMLSLAPHARLRADTRYTVERVFAYTDRGERLIDSERWRLAEVGTRTWRSRSAVPPPAAVIRRWYPDGWFVTGGAAEGRGPTPPVVLEAKVGIREGGGDCGPGTDVVLWYRAGAEVAATDVWAIERKGQGPVTSFAPLLEPARKDGRRGAYVGNTLCTSDRMRIDSGDSYEFRLVATSAAGARAAGPWVRARVEGTPTPEAATGVRMDFEILGQGPEVPIERWFGAPVTEAPWGVASGPVQCPWGFESTARQALASPSDPCNGLQPPLAVGWQAERAHVAFAAPGREGVVLRWPAGKAGFEIPGPVDQLRALFPAEGPLFAVTEHEEKGWGARVRFLRSSYDGKPLWKASPGVGARQVDPFLAAGRHVLLCWAEQAVVISTRNDLYCAVVDGKSGRLIRPPGPVPRRPRSKEMISVGRSGDAALAVEGGFLLAWTTPLQRMRDLKQRQAPTFVTRLDEQGNPLSTAEVPGDGGGNFDLARVGKSVALVRASLGGVDLTWLDLRGRPRGAPVLIGGGTGTEAHRPRVAARKELAAVVWEGGGDSVHVVAVAETGRPSVAAELGAPGLSPSAPAVSAAGDGFVVAYIDSDERAPYLEQLRCRASPPDGAPAQIVTSPVP
jgi:hypothetical protein